MSKGTFYILGAAVLWGTTGTAQYFAPDNASSLSVGALRLIVGGAVLLITAVLSGSFGRGGRWNIRHVAAGALGVAMYQAAFFTGVRMTGVAIGTVAAIGSGPVFAGILGLIMLGEKPEKNWYFSTALAVAGCSLLIFTGSGVSVNPAGVLLSVCAGFSYALYAVISKLLLVRHEENAVVAVIFFGGAMLIFPVLLFTDISWSFTARGALSVVYLGLFTTALSYILFARGLKTLSVAKTATLSLFEPFTASLLGILLLGERMNTQAFIGMFLLFISVLTLSIRTKSVFNS
ncbi:MAG: DMT family transporter [Deferribacterales bacterium]